MNQVQADGYRFHTKLSSEIFFVDVLECVASSLNLLFDPEDDTKRWCRKFDDKNCIGFPFRRNETN